MQMSKKLGKIGVLVGNCKGFVGNRMFEPYLREGQFLAEEGALPEEVDGAITGLGMALGPLALGDMAGLEIGYRIRKATVHEARHPLLVCGEQSLRGGTHRPEGRSRLVQVRREAAPRSRSGSSPRW